MREELTNKENTAQKENGRYIQEVEVRVEVEEIQTRITIINIVDSLGQDQDQGKDHQASISNKKVSTINQQYHY